MPDNSSKDAVAMASHAHGNGEVGAVHGMLIFGTGPIYLSHLPMFHAPHDRQLIMEVEFSGADDPGRIYTKDRATSGEKIYTWDPQRFVLSDLLNLTAGSPAMQGTIVRGHFERGGTPITGSDVLCVVRRVIHTHKLSAKSPRDPKMRYVVFGSAPATFAAHLVSGPPDFDQVIAVDVSTAPAENGQDVVVDGRKNEVGQRVQPKEQAALTVDGATGRTMKCLDEIYVESGELSE